MSVVMRWTVFSSNVIILATLQIAYWSTKYKPVDINREARSFVDHPINENEDAKRPALHPHCNY